MTMNEETIAIRAYTVPQKAHFKKTTPRPEIPVFDRILVFDTETTTDLYQNLKFGYFEIHQYDRLETRGIFYDRVIVNAKERSILEQHRKEKKISFYTLEEFRKIFLYETFELETLCIGFNLPFDLTRIALRSTNGRKRKKDAFSLEISKNLYYPRLHVTHATNTLSFIEWGSTMNKGQRFKGNFVDLRTLCHVLTDTKHKLESACEEFNTFPKKSDAKEHGIVNPEYIDYCINDVKSTHSLYQNTKKEFDTYGLQIPVTRAYTPASIGKEFLKAMGVKPFFNKNPKFSKEIIGNIMTGYFGGRTECKIRKTPVKVDVLDFLSMYPTVCTLQNLWKFVIADHVEHVDSTQEIIDFVDKFTIQDVQNKENWTKLQAIVLIEPQEDVLPIRAKYGQKHVWNIGISHVTSKVPLWYSLADVITSKLYTGKTPKILKAYRFVPKGIQKNLKKINIHGIEIDPYKDDLFKKLIEYRQTLKNAKDSRQQIIKIIANAISYGIFVEINTLEESDKVPIDIYGLHHFQQKKTKIEKSGFMFNPIIAVCITSASRLLLAVTETLLSNNGSSHAYCDTDSMMIPSEHTKEIQEFFQSLNPYSFDNDIFKLERKDVWFYGISAKRYCLYTMENNKITIKKDDYSSHGLGHLLNPFATKSDEKDDWHEIIWRDILGLHYGTISMEQLVEKYQNKYALSQLSISTPRILDRLKEFNEGKDYHNQIKPSNFSLVGFANATDEKNSQIKPMAPYRNPAKHAVYDYFVNYHDKSRHKLRGKQYWKTFWSIFRDYLSHSESKFDGNIGILERKHVVVTNVIHIGKESNNLEDIAFLGADSDSYEIYEEIENLDSKFKEIAPRILKLQPRDVKKFGISKQTLWNTKKKIKLNQINRISNNIQKKLIAYLML